MYHLEPDRTRLLFDNWDPDAIRIKFSADYYEQATIKLSHLSSSLAVTSLGEVVKSVQVFLVLTVGDQPHTAHL